MAPQLQGNKKGQSVRIVLILFPPVGLAVGLEPTTRFGLASRPRLRHAAELG